MANVAKQQSHSLHQWRWWHLIRFSYKRRRLWSSLERQIWNGNRKSSVGRFVRNFLFQKKSLTAKRNSVARQKHVNYSNRTKVTDSLDCSECLAPDELNILKPSTADNIRYPRTYTQPQPNHSSSFMTEYKQLLVPASSTNVRQCFLRSSVFALCVRSSCAKNYFYISKTEV